MAWNRRATIEILREQLRFLEGGGYRDATAAWRALFIFEDSPTCLNRDPSKLRTPCTACALVQFVPQSLQDQRTPCRYIPLNESHETVASFYRSGTQAELEAALAQWLRSTIAKLEKEEQDSHCDADPVVHVRAKFISLE